MRIRLSLLALATALCASILLIAEPARAVPGAPLISALDSTTAGEVSGTVTSAEPYVFVSVLSGPSDTPPTRTLITMTESTSFELPTWGYGAGALVAAWACPTSTYVALDCSARATSAFTPTDVVPEITWFTDDLIGPHDPDPAITVSDPTGGGVLLATFVDEYYSSGLNLVAVAPNGSTTIDLGDLTNVYGDVRLLRCSAADFLHCVSFNPDATKKLTIVRHIDAYVSEPIAPLTSVADTKFYLNTSFPGTAQATWHLESAAEPGVPITGTTQVGPVQPVNSFGDMDPLPIPRINIPDGPYKVVGTVDADTVYYGMFEDLPFEAPLTVDRHGPDVAFSAKKKVIYPYVNTATRPGSVTWNMYGPVADIWFVEVQTLSGKRVTEADPEDVSSTLTRYSWNGKWNDGKARAGTYRLVVRDHNRNPTIAPQTVTVDARRLVLKTWKRTLTAAGSLQEKFVARCSSLRTPASRGWAYSLGFYANTTCSTQTWDASAVATVHGTYLPRAEQYVDLRVSVYGGAATSRPRSGGVIRYLTTKGSWVNTKRVSPTLGWHAGDTRSASGLVFSDRSFGWGFATAYGDRYDVKSFTVVLRYKVLE